MSRSTGLYAGALDRAGGCPFLSLGLWLVWRLRSEQDSHAAGAEHELLTSSWGI